MSLDRAAVSCGDVHDDLALLAFGTLTGAERARALTHLESCASCRSELEGLSSAVDAIATLLPEAPSPAGLELRALSALRAERVPRRRRLRIAVAALVLAVAGAGVGLGLSLGGSSAPGGGSIETAKLNSTVGLSGEVVLSRGRDAWMLMTIEGQAGVTRLHCVVTLADGDRRDLGTFSLRAGYGSWAVDVGAPVTEVRRVVAVDDAGRVLASARFGA